MAMRSLRRQLVQVVAHNHLILKQPLKNEGSSRFAPVFNVISRRYTNLPQRSLTRGIQTEPEAACIQGTKAAENAGVCSSEAGFSPSEAFSYLKSDDAQNAVRASAASNLKASSRHDLAMVFTCKVCETRSVKTCCRESYEKGVVVARCGGCNNIHLIADRLGWFGEPGSVEDLLAERGEVVKKGSTDSIDITIEDLAGKKFL